MQTIIIYNTEIDLFSCLSYLCGGGHACITAHTWRSEDNFQEELVFSFNHVGSKYQSQIKSGAFTQGAILQALRIYLQQMETERSRLVDKLKHRAAAWSLRNTHIWNSSSS